MAATLTGRAVLPAVTFAPGPTSGKLIGPGPFNGIIPPFPDKQPIQGFSGALDRGDGTFEVMADNGFGAKDNSADFHLRVYTVRPNFVTGSGGNANVTVERFVEMLEGALKTDPDPKLTLRIFEFDTVAKAFTGRLWRYRLEDPGNALGDLPAINDHEFLIIERDGAQGPAATLKKVFNIDLSQIDSEGFVSKVEVLDLLDIADPNGISTSAPLPRPGDVGLGDTFRFPFVTIEDAVILSPSELLVINDNNFPFSAGRNPSLPDDNELIRVLLDDALDVDPEVLVRPPLLTARAELLTAAHATLEGAVEDAGASGMLALAAIQRARELFRVYAPKKLEKRLERLRKALRLTRAALQKAELGRAELAAGDFIEAWRLVGDAVPPEQVERAAARQADREPARHR